MSDSVARTPTPETRPVCAPSAASVEGKHARSTAQAQQTAASFGSTARTAMPRSQQSKVVPRHSPPGRGFWHAPAARRRSWRALLRCPRRAAPAPSQGGNSSHSDLLASQAQNTLLRRGLYPGAYPDYDRLRAGERPELLEGRLLRLVRRRRVDCHRDAAWMVTTVAAMG